jgi:CubicO group peptidase (beta-lactamase class C family)
MSFQLPQAERPEEVGLSAERLLRLNQVLRRDIEDGRIPGAVVLVARDGKIACLDALGYRDRQSRDPMTADTVFRVASMTKPFTSVCVMLLAEEGRLLIADPVSRYLPEFADLKVAIEPESGGAAGSMLKVTSMQQDMTVHDLLRHTSGLTYARFAPLALKQTYDAANLTDTSQTNAEMAAKLAELPLAYQPGSTWQYSMSTDVLGRIVEVVSGMELDRFIAERICNPLGLVDTGFVTADAARAAEPQVDPATSVAPPMRDVATRPKWISGGGGLLSTAGDYARFAHMLLRGGELGGIRLLSPTTVALMSSDHLSHETRYGPLVPALFGALAPMPEMGQGFGLGFGVRTQPGRNPLPGSVGDYFWSGLLGTYFWIDPSQRLVVILMMQAPLQRLHYRYLVRTLVYQAILL